MAGEVGRRVVVSGKERPGWQDRLDADASGSFRHGALGHGPEGRRGKARYSTDGRGLAGRAWFSMTVSGENWRRQVGKAGASARARPS
jgi:hypothetical protein